MSLEDMYRKSVRRIRKRDAALAKKGTTAGKEAANANLSNSQRLSSSAVWAIKNPDLAAYDNDGNPVDKSVWFD